MIPEFEVRILEHRDGHYVISDHMGAVTEISDTFDATYLRSAKDFVTRKWHRFPVETRADFEKIKKRYDPAAPERIPDNIKNTQQKQNGGNTDDLSMLTFSGIFWQLRDWCGFENLCVMMLDEPAFVLEMAEFWAEYALELLKRTLEFAVPRHVRINEDMAYKAHSMISPEMTRKFILPAYRKWVTALKRGGVPVIEVDSDGYIGELIPLWIGEGIDCCSPVEVAAYNDIVEYRREFGTDMAFLQGIDKRVIARGGIELERHVHSVVPEFIPGCDHGVPPDISWGNYVECARLLARYSGWF
jgi:uroporphyrinogen decarboxylase